MRGAASTRISKVPHNTGARRLFFKRARMWPRSPESLWSLMGFRRSKESRQHGVMPREEEKIPGTYLYRWRASVCSLVHARVSAARRTGGGVAGAGMAKCPGSNAGRGEWGIRHRRRRPPFALPFASVSGFVFWRGRDPPRFRTVVLFGGIGVFTAVVDLPRCARAKSWFSK